MANSLDMIDDRTAISFESITTNANRDPAAILLDGTTIVDLIGGVTDLKIVEGWNLAPGNDLGSVPHVAIPTIVAALETARASGESTCLFIGKLKISALPVKDGHGSTLVMLVFVPGIDNETRLMDELERVYSNLELTLKQSGVGIIEFDDRRPDWCFTTHIELLLGLPRGALLSSRKLVRDRIHPDDLEVNNKHRDLRDEGGQDTKYEMRLLDGNGNYRWFSIAIHRKTDVNRIRTQWAGTIADIDDLKNSQLASVDQVNRRDEFMAMLSHELRNPLMAIRYSVDLLTDFNQARATSREFLKIISRQTSQMSRLLDDIMDVSRLVQNRTEFESGTHSINDIIRDVVETVRSSIVEKRQSIHVRLCEDKLFVEGDVARIKQAVINVLENASKYTPGDGEIWVNSSATEEEICIEIQDSGIGISKADQERIFDLFYQKNKHGNAKQSRGMGVGLFLVKSVVEKHNGRITVSSLGDGAGSTFKIYLPLSTETEDESDDIVTEYSVGRKTVCLIEDIADSRIALKILLEHRGFEVFEFADAESALEKIPEINPDAAIIDIGLPGKSGLEVADDLRNKHGLKDMLMIALTGYGQEADCHEIDRVGFDQHLIKPAGIRKVCQVMSEFFEAPQQKAA